ncbi:MAG TPA: class II fructose-bisphosphate aldolase [Candidatus Woesebacteria bacterium]|nr:class II fructose-bisphosphate aldolase [Candidatus Woesebacteria bacterium]
MTPLKSVFQNCIDQHTALPSFNLDSFEIYQAVEKAVTKTGLPCLVQLSPNEDSFLEAEKICLLVKKANLHGLPIYLNMDHGNNVDRLLTLARFGFDMLHFDGSKMDYPTNLSTTKYFVEKVKAINPEILIEAEFNHINLVGSAIDESSYTTPESALDFINQTKADILAVSIGNLHGVSTQAEERLNISLFSQIKSVLPNTFFTLHGGSGISSDQIDSAIKLGIVKININTNLRLAFLKELRHQLTLQQSEKIYDYFIPTIDQLSVLIEQRLINFHQPKS